MGRNCIAIGKLVVEPLYCNSRIVLQLGCVVAGFVLQYNNCIVTRAVEWLKLYCNMVGLKGLKGCFFVLQYTWCIVAKKGLGAEDCIAIQLLYCNLGRLQ